MCIVLAFVFLFSSTTLVYSKNQDTIDYAYLEYMLLIDELFGDEYFGVLVEDLQIAHHGEMFMQNYEASHHMLNEFMSNITVQNRMGGVSYPDSFSGVYFDSDGNLVILTTDYHTDEFFVPAGRTVDTRVVQFSYNTLNELIDILIDISFSENSTLWDIADSIALDVSGNRIDVRLTEYSQEYIDLFRRTILDSPALYFVQSPYSPEIPFDYLEAYLESQTETHEDIISTNDAYIDISPASSYVFIPGRRIGNGSVGYSATCGAGRRGIVTTAHSAAVHTAPNGNIVASVLNPAIHRCIPTDSAFMTLQNGGTFIPSIPANGPLSNQFAGNPVQGMPVVNVGRTTNMTSGIITSPLSLWPGRYRAAESDFVSASGDSGGIVFHSVGSATHHVLGILVAIVHRPSGNVSIISRADIINRNLGLRFSNL